MSETSNTEVKINQEAQGAVDAAESKINAFSRFMGRTKKVLKDGDIPDDSKVTKADAFVTDMPQGKEETGSKGIAGFLADGVTGVILGLPLLLERGNKVKENEPVDIESEYQGSTKELEKEIKEEEKIREEGIDALKETAETGKKLDKKKVEDIKNIRPTGGSVKGNMPGSGLDSRRKDGTTTTTSSTSQGSTGPLTVVLEDGTETTDFREINKAKNQASSDQQKLLSGERVERKNVTITPQNAEKFEEAVDNLKVRLKKNVVDKNVDSVSAAKSVKSDDDDVKPVLNELEGERKDLAKERLQLEKQRKQIQSVYGRDSVEYEEIQIKITKNKEKVKELPKASRGGIIQGPQEGYPVSLDGKKVDFIGHGTEEVRQKEDGNGAFIVPIDTPDTRKDPTLQKRREKEAAAMGFKSFSAGGMNPDKVFGAPLLDKDSDLYKYSDIDKVHENIDTQGTKYEYNEELSRTTTKASEFDKPLKVEKKSSLMSPKEQYEFLVENLGGPQYVMQLVDGTYFPNVGLMMAEKWGDVARMVEKYMTEGAATVKEVSGVSVDKEVKLALKTFKKTFKDFERFKDRRTGEYDVEAMTSHLNSFVPGTIDYAKVQKKEAEKKERQQKLMENVKNKSEGGLLRVNTVNGYSMGGLLSGIMEYSNTESAPPAASSIIPIPVFQERPAPTGSVGSGKPPVSSEPTVISGSTEGEVMSAFLFTELGAS